MDKTLYDLLAVALNLQEVKKDNLANKLTALFEGDKINIPVRVFVDKKGNRFYLDKYGFHTTNQVININYNLIHKLEQAVFKKKLVDKYTTMMNEVLTKKTKKMIRIFLNSTHLTSDEKLEHIKNYIKNV